MFTSNLIDGIYVDGFGSVLVAAIILGIVNAITGRCCWFYLPLNVLTLGLLTFVINGFMLKLAAAVVGGFDIVRDVAGYCRRTCIVGGQHCAELAGWISMGYRLIAAIWIERCCKATEPCLRLLRI